MSQSQDRGRQGVSKEPHHCNNLIVGQATPYWDMKSEQISSAVSFPIESSVRRFDLTRNRWPGLVMDDELEQILVVSSILRCRLPRKRYLAENARTVRKDTLQQLSESREIVGRIRLHTTDVTIQSLAMPYDSPEAKKAARNTEHMKKRGNPTTNQKSVSLVHANKTPMSMYSTVMMAAANVASEKVTGDKEPAKLLSIVSMSLPKRFNIRPMMVSLGEQKSFTSLPCTHLGEPCHANGSQHEEPLQQPR
ncbi:hypothetical protein BU15DRAFT_68270 [Melanogaster broomeanus]|nr:hypothetical protein BU15DRAFT_68270 [Melanogaster broomeanus]